jgi:endonuclease/exonuclease/phosphatase family metal-dependent hydrolase
MLHILTYNVEFGLRFPEILAWLQEEREESPTAKAATHLPYDILCFQEFPQQRIAELHRAFPGYAHQFGSAFVKKGTTYGQLTFFRSTTLTLIASQRIPFGQLRREKLLFGISSDRCGLLTEFSWKTTGQKPQKFLLANIHPSWFTRNTKRLELFAKTIAALPDQNESAILVGDYNYSSLIGKSRLVDFFHAHNFRLANDGMTTHHVGPIAHQLDYVFVRNFGKVKTHVIELPYSDHWPVAIDVTQKLATQ